MTYPIIVPENPDTSVRKTKTKSRGWQLHDLSPRLLADIGVVRQRNGRYASASISRSTARLAGTGASSPSQDAPAP